MLTAVPRAQPDRSEAAPLHGLSSAEAAVGSPNSARTPLSKSKSARLPGSHGISGHRCRGCSKPQSLSRSQSVSVSKRC